MTQGSSVDELISILKEFPLKNSNLNEKSTLNESINLFGSLMLQRVRSLLLDNYPHSDFTDLTGNSSIHEIYLMISENDKIADNVIDDPKDEKSNHGSEVFYKYQTNLNSKRVNNQIISVGIDIESIKAFPSDVMLPSGASFRSNTFCPKEIGYASARSSPTQTLLGIFCAKEAVIKCCINLDNFN